MGIFDKLFGKKISVVKYAEAVNKKT